MTLLKNIFVCSFAITLLSGVFIAPSAMANDNHFDRPDRGRSCLDEEVQLLCLVDGDLGTEWFSTDCGRTRDGASCRRVYTPGLRQVKMRIRMQCVDGQWRHRHGARGWCELESWGGGGHH